MAQPVQYVFAATGPFSSGSLVATATGTQNVPLTLLPNASVAVLTSAKILIDATNNVAISFRIIGKDALGNEIGELLTTSGGTGLATSVQSYGVVTSITPTTLPGNNPITVDYDTGGTSVIFQGDVWNKQAIYAYAITRKGAGTLDVTPQYTLEPMPKFVNKQPVYNPLWIDLTAISAVSVPANFIINQPLTAFQFVTGGTNIASFTATVMQQGGYY